MKDKILHSGIFKLDDDGRPIGIVKLTSQKTLSGREKEYDPYVTARLKLFIGELERVATAYREDIPKSTTDYFSLQVIQPFVDSLLQWGLTPEQLGIDLKRAKKILWKDPLIRKHKAALEKSHEEDRLTLQAFSIFREYTSYRKGAICHYLEYVFKACGIPATSQSIARRHQRLQRLIVGFSK